MPLFNYHLGLMKKLVLLFLVVFMCVLCMVAGENALPEYVATGGIELMQEKLPCSDATFSDAMASIISSVRRQVEFTCETVAGIVCDCFSALRFVFEKI